MGNPRVHQGRHESTLLSRQPWRDHECKRLCTSMWINCAITQGWGAMPEEPLAALPSITSVNAGDSLDFGKVKNGLRPYRHRIVIHT